jgi:hypothetical protein
MKQVSCRLFSALKLETIFSSETSADAQWAVVLYTRRHGTHRKHTYTLCMKDALCVSQHLLTRMYRGLELKEHLDRINLMNIYCYVTEMQMGFIW